MLKRVSCLRYQWKPQRSRISNPSATPLFKPAGATHLYASKGNASTTDSAKVGIVKFRDKLLMFLNEKGTFYYLACTMLISLGLVFYYRKQKSEAILESGLAGYKSRNFRSRLTIVFDLDETLVSYGDKAYRLRAGVVPRPFLAELLDYLVQIDAEVIFWSSCSEGYMKEIISVLDPSGTKVSATIARDKSWFTADNYYEKNLHWLKRDMNDTLIIENRALAVRNCNANAILVDDFIRGEYVDTGIDLPRNDHALHTVKEIIADLETTRRPVPEYLADSAKRHSDIKEIPCERAIRQLRDELARGVFYFVGDKYLSSSGRIVHKSAQKMSQ